MRSLFSNEALAEEEPFASGAGEGSSVLGKRPPPSLEVDEAAASKKTIVRTITTTVSYDKDGRVISTFQKETVESTVHVKKFYEVGEDDYVKYENDMERLKKIAKNERTTMEKVIVENRLCYIQKPFEAIWEHEEVEIACMKALLSVTPENWKSYVSLLKSDLRVTRFLKIFTDFFLDTRSAEDLSEHQFESYFIKPLQDLMISDVLAGYLAETRPSIKMIVEGNTYRPDKNSTKAKRRQEKADEGISLNHHCFYVFELKRPAVKNETMRYIDLSKIARYLRASSEGIPGFCPLGMTCFAGEVKFYTMFSSKTQMVKMVLVRFPTDEKT